MREYVKRYIHLSMSEKDIKDAVRPFINSETTEEEIMRMESEILYNAERYNDLENPEKEARLWDEYLELKDDDSYRAYSELASMLHAGREYRKNMENGKLDEEDARYWDHSPVGQYDFSYLVQHEARKIHGRHCLRILEDHEEEERSKQQQSRGRYGRGMYADSHKEDSSTVKFLRKIGYANPHEKLIYNNDAQWKIIHGLSRKKARELHPDKHPGRPEATEEFQELEDERSQFKYMHFPDLSTQMTRPSRISRGRSVSQLK
jgi:hypothetical protein